MINKNVLLVLTFLTTIAVTSSCKKEDNSSENTGTTTSLTTEQKLTRKWKLTGLVNKSDEQKYVNGILDLKTNKSYTNTFADGSSASSGTWSTVTDSLFLTDGVYSNGNLPHYKITLLSETELQLSEHYTLDNKDAILEYHYKAY